MQKWFFFVLLFLSSINQTIPIKVEVEYDDYLDVVTLNGKMYLPADSKIAIKSYVADGTVKEEFAENPECEEELVTGSTLYFYLFMVLCKLYQFTLS